MTKDRSPIHRQLGEFLRQRRESCDPERYGLPVGRRRTSGLRREEVAEMSGISADWYARLEQGRESSPSKATIAALSRTLRLTAAERNHLYSLVGAAGKGDFKKEVVPTDLEALIQSIPTPAYVTGSRKDLLCWNHAATDLFRDFSLIPSHERNTLWQMFTEPTLRKLFVTWEDEARAMLESFRADYDLWSHTPEFDGLVTSLNERSPEFRRWWKLHAVRTKNSGLKEMNHARLGRIKLRYASFRYADKPSLTLIIYTRIL